MFLKNKSVKNFYMGQELVGDDAMLQLFAYILNEKQVCKKGRKTFVHKLEF